MKKIAILQSNYIPWKGYFDIINLVDEFIIYDEVQYTKNDWRNRNKIKGPNGVQWITIPCRRERLSQKISEIKISNKNWYKKHLNSFQVNYSKAACFNECIEIVTRWYEQVAFMNYLSDVNLSLIKMICEYLKIDTKISLSETYKSGFGKNYRLIGICKDAHANTYLTGHSARNYLNENLFTSEGIEVEYMNYKSYPEYQQIWPPFEHKVSIIDLIFNMGINSTDYI